MTKIDTNLFKDIWTQSTGIPTQDSVMEEMFKQNVKIMRLKSAAWWIDYIALVPNIPEWLKEQQAILNHVDRLDTLL